jgi:hypothetical protein
MTRELVVNPEQSHISPVQSFGSGRVFSGHLTGRVSKARESIHQIDDVIVRWLG